MLIIKFTEKTTDKVEFPFCVRIPGWSSNAYLSNLTCLMRLMGDSFRVDDLSVIISEITDSGKTENGNVWNCGE